MGFGKIYEPTPEELSLQINTLQREVERLQNNYNRVFNNKVELDKKINSVRDYILNMYSIEPDLDEYVVDIADLLDITLTKRYAVDITVTYRGEVEIAAGQDIKDLEDQISFDFNLDQGDGWEIEIEQDDVKIKHEDRWWL
jgi:archaellum component FlaC